MTATIPMRLLAILTATLIGTYTARGESHSYPLDKRPSLSMGQACGIGERLLAVLGFDKEYFFTDVSLWGDGTGSGGGAWHLECRNMDGDSISMSIHINNDYCHVSSNPRAGGSKLNGYKDKGYTRDGQVSKEWLERERRLSRILKMPPVPVPVHGSKADPRSEEAEQAGAGESVAKPADKVPVKDQPSTPAPRDATR